MKKGDKKHPEFEQKSCRVCGYWVIPEKSERCPNCATFHPLKGRYSYKRGSLIKKFFKGGLLGGLAGTAFAGLNAWMHTQHFSLIGIPLTAISSGIFGALLAKSMGRFSEKSALMSIGMLFGGAAALLYTLGWPLPSLLWIAGGAWAGHRFMHDSLFSLPRQRLMELEDEIFHEKVLAKTEERQKAIGAKLDSFQKIKSEAHQRQHDDDEESIRTLKQAETTLHQALASYETLQVKTRLHLLENKLRKWKDNLFEVSDESEAFYRHRLQALQENFLGFEQTLQQNKDLPLDTREELIGHTQRAVTAIKKLEVEVTKRSILAETRNVSGIPDAHLSDDALLSPRSDTTEFAYEDLSAELVNYDVFNELEDEYVRLKVEQDIGLMEPE